MNEPKIETSESLPLSGLDNSLGESIGVGVAGLAGKRVEEKTQTNPDGERWSEEHSEFAYFLHLYIRDFIKFADQKAAFILAVTSTILTFLARQGAQRSLLAPIAHRSLTEWFATVSCLLVGISALLALLVVLPRLRGKPSGIVYWGALLQRGGASAYKHSLRPLDSHLLIGEILEHCYELAEIADSKYELLKWSIWLGAVGAIAAAFVLLGL